jgi:hypothetical protein
VVSHRAAADLAEVAEVAERGAVHELSYA